MSNTVAKKFSHTFAAMFSQSNHIRKIVSAGLLIVLLLIHSVKLLHSHSNAHIGKADKSLEPGKSFNTENRSSSNDCGICSYHLTKDADDLTQFYFNSYRTTHPGFITQKISFSEYTFLSAFETRGPPTTI